MTAQDVAVLLATLATANSAGTVEDRCYRELSGKLLRLSTPALTFELCAGPDVAVNGRRLTPRTRAIRLLWWLVETHQRGAPAVHAALLWPGRRAAGSCRQAFDRAAIDLEQISRPMASLAAGVRTKGGLILLPPAEASEVQLRLGADLLSLLYQLVGYRPA